MKATVKASPATPWTLVSNPQQLATLTRNKALLAGEAVFVSTREISVPDYTVLAPRRAAGWLTGWGQSERPQLHVAVSSQILTTAARGTRFALAVDAYLQWGLRSRGKVLLIGGCDGPYETSLDILLFEDGTLVDYANKTLPGRSVPHFHAMLTTLLDDYAQQRPGYKVVQAAPLAPFGPAFAHIQQLDGALLRRLAFRPVQPHVRVRPAHKLLPLALVGLALLAYTGLLAKGWHDYRDARSNFAREVADPIVASHGGLDTGLIDTIQQRRFFLDETRRQVELLSRARSVVAGISQIEHIKIIELRLPPTVAEASPAMTTAQPAGSTPDLWLRVSVPLAEETALEQGRKLMQQLSTQTGLDMRLTRQGWSDDGKRRYFIVEGFKHA